PTDTGDGQEPVCRVSECTNAAQPEWYTSTRPPHALCLCCFLECDAGERSGWTTGCRPVLRGFKRQQALFHQQCQSSWERRSAGFGLRDDLNSLGRTHADRSGLFQLSSFERRPDKYFASRKWRAFLVPCPAGAYR